ncbi:MAG: PAS domain-containing protein, partial [Nitrospiraceae bacterium]|nr:PAS domain-containing protein [Nitrospiraceae bacterium]
GSAPPGGQDDADERVKALHLELVATKEYLRTVLDESEGTAGELKNTLEELTSSNEELQSINEEMETAREELQSTNEELLTVNDELQQRNTALAQANTDISNLLSSVDIPILMLDSDLAVRRYTPAAAPLFNLIPSDVGRPIIDLSQENLGPDLIADAREVLDHLVPLRKESMINGTWYIRAILPYRTADNRIEGVIVTYNDIADLKRAEECTRHLASFPQLDPNPVIEVDSSGKVTFSNPGTEKILEDLGMDKAGVNVFLPADMDNILRDLGKQEASALYREVIVRDRVFDETIQLVPQGNVARIYAFDITERKRADEALRGLLREKETLLKELYHRTKNNMHVISSLLSLQAGSFKDQRILEVFRDTQNRIGVMALVHEMLYKTNALSELDLKEYLKQICRLTLASYKTREISLKYDEMDSVPVSPYVAVPCGLILNELVSNSVKHAFPGKDSGEVTIRLKIKENEIKLSYSDNGIGFPEGFRIEGSRSLGLRLVEGLVKKQLSGSLEIIKDEGAKVVIRFDRNQDYP